MQTGDPAKTPQKPCDSDCARLRGNEAQAFARSANHSEANAPFCPQQDLVTVSITVPGSGRRWLVPITGLQYCACHGSPFRLHLLAMASVSSTPSIVYLGQ